MILHLPLFFILTLCWCCLPSFSHRATYHLTENIVGPSFYPHFDWEVIDDPSHGRVNYVDERTSIEQNLTYATFDAFILRTDYKTVLDPAEHGRNSVRIRSKNAYTNHVAMTWPGIRETKEADKPNGGLIDILEGVNDQAPDLITLHTTAGCTMPPNRTQTGTSTQLDCNVAINSNAGCGVLVPGSVNYGPAFNDNGGGWYAIERTEVHISIWFWPRNNPTVPLDVTHGSLLVDPESWGIPTAYFPNTTCDFTQHFEEHNIIINLTLCGDWAGNAYPSSCSSTCIEHVNNDPAAFKDAYFEFASLRVYQP